MRDNTPLLAPKTGRQLTPKGIRRRSKILEIASQLLIEGGVESFSLSRTAELAGITLSNVQYYFPTKKDLLHAFLLSQIDPAEEMYFSAEEGTEDGDQLLSKILEYGIELGTQDEPCAVVWTMCTTALSDDDMKGLADQWFGSYRDLLTRALLRQNPSLSKEQLKFLSLSIMYMVEGQALIWRHTTPGPRQRKVAQRALMADIMLLIESRRAA
jgi:AcrR family transcriptional regulator